MQSNASEIAQALLKIGAVIFTPHQPITFKSGILSPVYVDNRRLPFWPGEWKNVIQGFARLIAEEKLTFDVIAGIEAAGIPHSAALAFSLEKPSVFIRKQAKEHGTRSRIEGGDVAGKRVLLVEDLVTMGGSSLSGVEALRDVGAVVEHCLCITTYGFPESQQAFDAAQVHLHPLTPFRVIAEEAVRLGQFGTSELETIDAWMRDPHHWSKKE